MNDILNMLQRQIVYGWDTLQDIINVPKRQRRLIMVIVCVALLLDNMLYMVIVSIFSIKYVISILRLNCIILFFQVPIIPDYLQSIGAWTSSTNNVTKVVTSTDKSTPKINNDDDDNAEDVAVGTLFGSKAIIQLLINPFSGALIDRIGYDIPMCIGLCVIFLSTTTFAFGRSYGVLFVARSLQGVGSAFADTSGLGIFKRNEIKKHFFYKLFL